MSGPNPAIDLETAKLDWNFTWDAVQGRVRGVLDEFAGNPALEGAITAALLDAFESGYWSAIRGLDCQGNA